ncbi:MAG: histone deacetylase [Verrucomicrobiae bacterium]|nr:histone deacetylase [Verrucomicrobiae bacterium]
MTIITDERCVEYAAPGHPERPQRILATMARLKTQKELSLAWLVPEPATEAALLAAHEPALVQAVRQPAGDFDADTPAYPDIYGHALRASGGALAAVNLARQGEAAFSLMRPPGHHATRGEAMGFCYFNHVAVAAYAARAAGARRVAVFDFDVHHGNGTEDILLDQPGMLFCSVHQSPAYPGTGLRHRGSNCFNYPVPPHTPRPEYRAVLAEALEKVRAFQPDFLLVSAGFDAYHRDPLAQETLEAEDFRWLGAQIRGLEVPAAHVLEGGYSKDLPELILHYLRGLMEA